jgi:ATP-dependent helicase/nuclease subunit B
MPLHLHIHPAPRRLLTSAADAFLRPQPPGLKATPPYLLLLRQGGLRDDLLTLASEQNCSGWFDPPLAVFAQIPDVLGATAKRPVGDYERMVLVERALRETIATTREHTVLGRQSRPEAWLDALDRFFGELASEGVSPDDLEAATKRAPGTDAFERRRDAEVARVYQRYMQLLDAANARDGRDRLIDTARAIANDPQALAQNLNGRREIRIVGLQDLKGGWTALLRALLDSPAIDAVRIYSSSPLPLPADLAPMLEPLGDEPAERAPHRLAFVAPDVDREVEEIAVRIRRLIEKGTPPHRIAVVARQARPYVDLVCDALGRVRVPVTARRRHGFAEIPVVRALLALFRVAAEGWTRRGLVELAAQPYLGIRLATRLIDDIGFRRRVTGLDGWLHALERLHDDAQRLEQTAHEQEDGGARTWLPPSSRVAQGIEQFRAFIALARALDEGRPLSGWLHWLEELLAADPWRVERALWRTPAGAERIIRLDLAGWRGIRQIVGEWRDAVDAWGGQDEPLDVRAFERRLREVLSGDAALWTETRRGVQVLEALAAAQRSFDHVFLVGLDASRLPVRAPRSPLFDEADRERLIGAGLPLEARETWDARERELFRLLACAATASLALSWSRLDAEGAEVAQSSFAEAEVETHGLTPDTIPTARVLTPGLPHAASRDAIDFALHGARIERIRDTGVISPWNGAIVDATIGRLIADRLGDDFVWSPTQLESYAKCPWAWFSARLLRVVKQEDPELDIDARVRGTLYHDALKRFYDAARAHVGAPVFLRDGDRTWAMPMLRAALATAMHEAQEELWLGHAALRPTKEDELRRELEKYLDAEIALNEGMHGARNYLKQKIVRTGVDAHELPFDNLAFERDGVRVRLRGFIDRVEVGIDDRVACEHLIAAVDYKSSKYSAPGSGKKEAWDENVVLQVPLYAWALTQLRPGRVVARTEYRAIRQGETVHALHLHEVDRKLLRLTVNHDNAARLETALDAVAKHVRNARDGVYPASPAPSCKCPDYCHAREICRVKGGPTSQFDW